MPSTFQEAIKRVLINAVQHRGHQGLLEFSRLMVGRDRIHTPELRKAYDSLTRLQLDMLKYELGIAFSEQFLKLVDTESYKQIKRFLSRADQDHFLSVLAGKYHCCGLNMMGELHPMMSSLRERLVHPVIAVCKVDEEGDREFKVINKEHLEIDLADPSLPDWVLQQRRHDFNRAKGSIESVIREYITWCLDQVRAALERGVKLNQLFKSVERGKCTKEQALKNLKSKQGALMAMITVLEDAYADNQKIRIDRLNTYIDWMWMTASSDPLVKECYGLLIEGMVAESVDQGFRDPDHRHASLKQALAAYWIHPGDTYDDVLSEDAVVKPVDWPDVRIKELYDIDGRYTELVIIPPVKEYGEVPQSIEFARLTIKPGNLFAAVSLHVNMPESTLRWLVAGHMLARKEHFAATCPDGELKFEAYVNRIASGEIDGGECEWHAIQALLGRPIVMLHENGCLQVLEQIEGCQRSPIFVAINGHHYDGLQVQSKWSQAAVLTFLQTTDPSGKIVVERTREMLGETSLIQVDMMDESYVDLGMAYEDGADPIGQSHFFPDISLDMVGDQETFALEDLCFQYQSQTAGSLFAAMSDCLGVDEASLRHGFAAFASSHEDTLSIHNPGGGLMFEVYLNDVREGRILGGGFEIKILQYLTGRPIVFLDMHGDMTMLVPMAQAQLPPACMQVHRNVHRALVLLGDMTPQAILDGIKNQSLCGSVFDNDAESAEDADTSLGCSECPSHEEPNAKQCTLLHLSMLYVNPPALACLLGSDQNNLMPGYVTSPFDEKQSVWQVLFNVSVQVGRMRFLGNIGSVVDFVSQYLGHDADLEAHERTKEVRAFLLRICDQYKAQGSIGWTHPVVLQAYAMLMGLPVYFWMADVGDQGRLVPYESDGVVFGMPQLKEPQSADKRADFLIAGPGHESFARLHFRGYATAFPQVDIPVYPLSYRMIGRPVNKPRSTLLDVVQGDPWRKAWDAAKARCDAAFKKGSSDGLQHQMKIATEQSLNQVLHAVNTDGKTFCEIKGEGGNKAAHYLMQMNLSSAIAHLEGVDAYNDQLVKACKMYDDDGFTLVHWAFQNKRYGLVWRMLSRYMVDAGIPTRLKNGTPGITLMDMVESSLLQPDHSGGDGWVINQASDSYRFYESIRKWCQKHRENHNTYLEQLKSLDKFKGNQEDYERRRALLSAEWDSMRMCRDFAMPTAADPRDSVARHWSPMEVGMEMLVDNRKSYRAQSGFIQRFRLSGIRGIFSRKDYLTRLHQRELAYAHIGMDVVMAQFAQDDNRLVYGLSDWRIQNVENAGRTLLLKECGYALTKTGYSHCVTTVGEAKAGEAQAKEETAQAKEETAAERAGRLAAEKKAADLKEETAQAKEETAVERAARLKIEGELKKLREENKRLQEEMRRRERGEAEPGAAVHEKVSINGDGEGPSESQADLARERYEALERRRREGVALSEATNGSHGVMNFGTSVSD